MSFELRLCLVWRWVCRRLVGVSMIAGCVPVANCCAV